MDKIIKLWLRLRLVGFSSNLRCELHVALSDDSELTPEMTFNGVRTILSHSFRCGQQVNMQHTLKELSWQAS